MGLAYAHQVWMTCNTSCDYTQPTQHHKKQKYQYHDLPHPLAFGFNFIGECDHRMLQDWSQSTQHMLQGLIAPMLSKATKVVVFNRFFNIVSSAQVKNIKEGLRQM